MDKIKQPKQFKKLIQTKRLNLKPLPGATFKLSQFLYDKITTQREHFKFLPLSTVKTPEEEYEFLRANKKHVSRLEHCTYGIYLRKGGDLIGLVNVHSINWNRGTGDFGAWLFQEYTRNGYMIEAATALENYMFELKFHKLVWKAATNNKASIRVAKNLGFVKEGIEREAVFNKYMNVWENQVVLSKLRSELNKK